MGHILKEFEQRMTLVSGLVLKKLKTYSKSDTAQKGKHSRIKQRKNTIKGLIEMKIKLKCALNVEII